MNKPAHTPGPLEVVEAVGGEWIVLCNGFQWGKGPLDMSGCSSETWPTKAEALLAIKERINRHATTK